MSLIIAPIVARELGPSDRGLMASAVAALAITPILIGMGLPLVVRRYASVSDPGPVVRTVRRILPLGLPVAVGLGYLLTLTLIPGLGQFAQVSFLIAMGSTVLFISSICDQSVFIARQEYHRVAGLQLTQSLSYAVIVLVLWLVHSLTIESVILALGAANAIAFIVARAQVRVGRGDRLPSRATLRDGVRYVGSQLTEVSSSRLDQLLAVAIIGATNAGYYAIAVTIATIPLALGHSLGSSLFRRVANSAGEERADLVSFGFRGAVLLGVAGSAILAALTPWGIPLLFGADFEPSVAPTLIALLGAPLFVANYVTNQMLAALGRGSAMLVSQGAGLLAGVALLLALGGLLGAEGAAIASGVGYLVTAVFAVRFLRVRMADFRVRRDDLKRVWRLFFRGQ